MSTHRLLLTRTFSLKIHSLSPLKSVHSLRVCRLLEPPGYKEGSQEIAQKHSYSNAFNSSSTRSDAFRKFSFESKLLEKRTNGQSDRKRENIPMIISTKEVLRNIYSNGHVLPTIKKSTLKKQANFPKQFGANFAGYTGVTDTLSKTQQFKDMKGHLCIIRDSETGNLPGSRPVRPNTTAFANGNVFKMGIKQFDANNLKI